MAVDAEVSTATVADDVFMATVVVTTVVRKGDVTWSVVDERDEVINVLDVEVKQVSSCVCRAVTPSGQQPYSECKHDSTSPEDV